MFHRLYLHLFLLFQGLLSTVAVAQAIVPACPPGNLVSGKAPHQVSEVLRPSVITDGQQTYDGASWDTRFTSVMSTESSYVIYDLGQLVILKALVVQADNNDTYEISTSENGSYFHRVETVPTVSEPGMQIRAVRNLNVPLRYLRIGLPQGDGAYSIGEIQAYCHAPADWPPETPRVGVRPTFGTAGSTLEAQWNENPETRLRIHRTIIGLLGLLVFASFMWPPLRETRPNSVVSWVGPAAALSVASYAACLTFGFGALAIFLPLGISGYIWISKRKKRGMPWLERAQNGSMILVLGVGALTWTNFGAFNGTENPTVHVHDFMHYYMGSKYFAENDYRWLYHCVLLAEIEDGHDPTAGDRRYRSLKDNRLGPAEWIAQEAETVCRQNFAPERWRAFQQDVRMFRALVAPRSFAEIFMDHGYNATPAWTMIGSALSNWNWESGVPDPNQVNSPANLEGKPTTQVDLIEHRFAQEHSAFYSRVKQLAWIDSALYAGIFIMITWAFGLPSSALAILAWSVGDPWSFLWTGGSLGRVSWLFMAVAGMCFLKKGHHTLGGAAIAWSLLLRVFPGALGGGLALVFLWNGITRRRVDRTHLQVLGGAVGAAVLIVSLSLALTGGPSSYSGFFANSAKHIGTPLTNHMGLRTLVTFDPRYVARIMETNQLDEPASEWKIKRHELFEEREPLYWSLLLGMVLLVGAAARRMENWEAMAISTLLIVGVFELTNYYYCFLLLLAPLCAKRPSYAAALIATSVGTQLAALWTTWADERSVVSSALILTLMLYVIGAELTRPRGEQVPSSGVQPRARR